MIDEPLAEDMSDPVDVLLAMTEDPTKGKARSLDFVRAKFKTLKSENKRLRDRVADLEQTLSIVQTAQEWTVGKGMTPEQAEKMKEIKALLEQAKRAREEIQNFSGASRAALYEKLRACKNALRREKEKNAEMKERLLHAFDHAKAIREQHQRLAQQRTDEQEKWQEVVREMKQRHLRELRRLQGDSAAMESDRHDQLSHFGEQVIGELSALQQHLKEVRQETVDSVVLEGGDLDAGLGPSPPVGGEFSGGEASGLDETG